MMLGVIPNKKSFMNHEYTSYEVLVKTTRKQSYLPKKAGFRWNHDLVSWKTDDPEVLEIFSEKDHALKSEAKKLLNELTENNLMASTKIIKIDNMLYAIGNTYEVKDALKKLGFKWGGKQPEPHWKCPVDSLFLSKTHLDLLPTNVRDVLESFEKDSKKELDAWTPEGINLYQHQKEGVNEIANNQSWLYRWEMGSGKTFPPLSYGKTTDKKVFAVVPASLRLNWFREADKFEMRPSFYPKLPTMRAKFKDYFTQYENEDNQAMITSYATFNSTVRLPKSQRKKGKPWEYFKKVSEKKITELVKQYDLFVFDESHYIKNYKAQRTKSVLALVQKAKEMGKKVLFMTGTAILNRPAELYTTMRELVPRLEGFKDFTRRYNGAYHNGYGWTMGPATNLDELTERLSEVSSIVTKEDALDLPDKVRQDILLHGVKVDRPEKPSDPSEILGFLQKYKRAVAEAKIDATVELAVEAEPCLVFTHFKNVNAEITEQLQDKGLRVGQIYSGVDAGDRDQIVQDYQNGKLDVVVCGIKAAGMGLTLTRGSQVIFNDMAWSPGYMLQAEDRAHRVGQDKKVTVSIMVAQDEFDEMLFKKVSSKFNVIKKVLEEKDFEEFSEEASEGIFKEMRTYFSEKFKLKNNE